MLILRGVEKICRSELTLPARLGRQDKSNGAWVRLSHCLHIQDLELARSAMSLAKIFWHSDYSLIAFPFISGTTRSDALEACFDQN
jgi:hypothetical protein